MSRTLLKFMLSLLVLGTLALSGSVTRLNERPVDSVEVSYTRETADFLTGDTQFPSAMLAQLQQLGKRLSFFLLVEPECWGTLQPPQPSGSNNLIPDCWLTPDVQSIS